MSASTPVEETSGSAVATTKVTCSSTRTCARAVAQNTHTNPRRAVDGGRPTLSRSFLFTNSLTLSYVSHVSQHACLDEASAVLQRPVMANGPAM